MLVHLVALLLLNYTIPVQMHESSPLVLGACGVPLIKTLPRAQRTHFLCVTNLDGNQRPANRTAGNVFASRMYRLFAGVFQLPNGYVQVAEFVPIKAFRITSDHWRHSIPQTSEALSTLAR